MNIRITGKNIKLSRNTLFLAKSDNRKTATSFYNKKQGYDKKIGLCSDF